jgi:hypothetical protein
MLTLCITGTIQCAEWGLRRLVSREKGEKSKELQGQTDNIFILQLELLLVRAQTNAACDLISLIFLWDWPLEMINGLKGQCCEMVVEIRQWSGRLCLN